MDPELNPPIPGRPARDRPAPETPPHIVYLDPDYDRPVSPYSPEGEIRMMGDLATGLSRRRPLSRTVAIMLVLLVSLPIILSLLAVLTTR